jgi:predicted small secreted protein
MADTSSMGVNFSYKGDTHFIDLNTLITTQAHFLTALTEINKSQDASVKLNIKIEAVKPGSFELNQLLEVTSITGLFASPALGYIDNLFSILSNYISISSFLKGEKPGKVVQNTDNSQTVEIHIHGSYVTVEKGAFELYQNNQSISQAVYKMGQSLLADEDVDGLELTDIKTEKPLLKVNKEQFKELSIRNPYLDSDTKEEIKDGEILIITKPDIDPKKVTKWNFIYNGRRLNNVIIRDSDFLLKVKDAVYKFGNGDALRVNLRVVYKLDTHYNVFIEKQFEIMSVIEPIFRNKQSEMFRND